MNAAVRLQLARHALPVLLAAGGEMGTVPEAAKLRRETCDAVLTFLVNCCMYR